MCRIGSIQIQIFNFYKKKNTFVVWLLLSLLWIEALIFFRPQNNHKQLVSAVAALFLRFEYYFCLWLIIWVNCAFASLQRKVNWNLDERKRVLIFGFAPKLRPLIRCVFISFLLPSRQRPSFTDLIWCCCLCASAAFFSGVINILRSNSEHLLLLIANF